MPTILSSFFRTNLFDDHLADDVNKLLSASLYTQYANTETIAATRQLVDLDTPYQILTASGGDQTVKLAVEAVTNHPFIIENGGGSNSLVVKDDSAAITYITLAPGEAVFFLQVNGVGWIYFEKRETQKKYFDGLYDTAPYNYLVNGGFDFAQRQAPGTLTNITDNKCGPDRWRVTRGSADVQFIRQDATGETGLTSKYYGQFKKITNAGKIHICQIVEGNNSVPLRGKTVTFQVKMKASASKTIRMAVLELQNAGTMDTIPATLVTAFGADSTDPTLGTNVAVITAAQSKSVTTAWQAFSVSVTVPSNSKNLLCAIWSDAGFAVNDTLSIAEAALVPSTTLQPWNPRLMQQELALCQRYYVKSFLLDTAPAQNIGVDTGDVKGPASVAGAATNRFMSYELPVYMFAAPTVTVFNPSAANAQIRDATAAVDCSSTVVVAQPNSLNFQCTGNAATVVGNGLRWHFTAEAEL